MLSKKYLIKFDFTGVKNVIFLEIENLMEIGSWKLETFFLDPGYRNASLSVPG